MKQAVLRVATVEDCDMIFEWANDAVVRKNSFSSSLIKYEDHVKWYKKVMETSDIKQYILVVDEQNVGQARINVDDKIAEISYSIAPHYRGNGYGELIISLIPEVVKSDFPNVKTLVAQVKLDNIASQKAFKNNSYTEKCLVYEFQLD